MGIQSTRTIKREEGIHRIRTVSMLIINKNYRELEKISFETDVNIQEFVDNWKIVEIKYINNWTNKMLADFMDNPFFRHSMFDNYLVENDDYFN